MSSSSSSSSTVTYHPSNLILGLGIGTFVLLFFFIILFFVFLFTIPCGNLIKTVTRVVTTILYVILALSLIYADRQPQHPSTEVAVKNYDNSIIPRISISIIMIIFSIISLNLLWSHFQRKEELSTIVHDYHDLWQN